MSELDKVFRIILNNAIYPNLICMALVFTVHSMTLKWWFLGIQLSILAVHLCIFFHWKHTGMRY